jgi:hypothetical protein
MLLSLHRVAVVFATAVAFSVASIPKEAAAHRYRYRYAYDPYPYPS